MSSKPMVAVLAGLVCALGAQEDAVKVASPASTAYARLKQDHAAAMRSVAAAAKAMQQGNEWQEALAAKDRATMDKLRKALPQLDRDGFAKRALTEAAAFGAEAAVPFYCWAATVGFESESSKAALAALQKDHLRSAGLEQLLESGSTVVRVLGQDEADGFFDEVIAATPHAIVRAWAMYWKARPMLRGNKVTEAGKAKAAELMAAAEALAAGTLLGDRIAAPRFEQERLQIGMSAPDIEGVDIDGTAFKLSDYRGKVVVLDFWGFW